MSDQNKDENHEWKFMVNLSGLQAPTGGSAALDMGYYKAVVKAMYTKKDKPNRVVIRMEISEGRFMGVVRHDGLGIPKGDDDGVRYYWRGLAESAGYGPGDLDSGELKLSPAAFTGKTVHIFYTPEEQASDGYESIDFLPPAVWAQRSSEFVAPAPVEKAPAGSALGGGGGNAGGQALGGDAGGQALGGGGAALGGGGTTTTDEVKNALGL